MSPEPLLARLDQLQAETLAVLARAGMLLKREPATARAGLAEIRWELARRLREYQIFKHSRIFDPAITSGSPSLAETARYLKADCIAANAAFERYVREWSSRDVVADWSAFRPATFDLGRRLRDHLAAEKTQIDLLLAEAARRGGVIAAGAAPRIAVAGPPTV